MYDGYVFVCAQVLAWAVAGGLYGLWVFATDSCKSFEDFAAVPGGSDIQVGAAPAGCSGSPYITY